MSLDNAATLQSKSAQAFPAALEKLADLERIEQVVAEVSSRFKANPKTVFLIGGAKDVPYDEIIKALNLLHSAGVKSVGLMTQPI